jgi:ribonuclease Z
MRPALHPRLVNPPESDPAVYIPFLFQNRAVLFDLGNLEALTSREILKISHVFVSHMHMDHFYGFDRLLRICLGRNKRIHLFGPEHFLDSIRGKLAAYTWDLVQNYPHSFTIEATEIRPDGLVTQEFPCRTGFNPMDTARFRPASRFVHSEPGLHVACESLDHSIVSMAYALKERFHIHILRDQLDAMGLPTGPWLSELKKAIYRKEDPESEFQIPLPGRNPLRFSFQELCDRVTRTTPGQKIAYITDALYTEANIRKMISLAENADHLFIEAAFLEEHRELARRKNHLTAAQAGTIAGLANVRQFTIFHFSPRYSGMFSVLEREAREAFGTHFKGTKNGRMNPAAIPDDFPAGT